MAGLIAVDIAPKGYHWEAHQQEFAAMNALDLANLPGRAAAEKEFESPGQRLGDAEIPADEPAADRATGRWKWSINLPVITAALPVLEEAIH